MKKLLLMLFLICGTLLFPQSNKYLVEIKNGTFVNPTTYEFDIYIQTPKSINLTAYQGALSFKQEAINGGKLTLEYISGTSQLTNIPYDCDVKNMENQEFLTTWSMPGLEQITGTKLIGKFRLTNTVEFPKNTKLDLKFNFVKNMNTIFAGTDYKDITNDFIYKPK